MEAWEFLEAKASSSLEKLTLYEYESVIETLFCNPYNDEQLVMPSGVKVFEYHVLGNSGISNRAFTVLEAASDHLEEVFLHCKVYTRTLRKLALFPKVLPKIRHLSLPLTEINVLAEHACLAPIEVTLWTFFPKQFTRCPSRCFVNHSLLCAICNSTTHTPTSPSSMKEYLSDELELVIRACEKDWVGSWAQAEKGVWKAIDNVNWVEIELSEDDEDLPYDEVESVDEEFSDDGETSDDDDESELVSETGDCLMQNGYWFPPSEDENEDEGGWETEPEEDDNDESWETEEE